jgi:SAM-dependent methyltransferase
MQSSLSTVDVLCPADAIPLPDQSFDVVLCTQTIEHIANFPGVLREAYRLLRPGGLFFLSAPMYWHLHEEPYDFFRFTKYGLQVGLEQAGFDVEQVEPNGGKWSLLGLALLHTLPPRLTGWRWFTGFTNSLFLWLDQRQFDAVNTSNYFVTARRPHRDRAL